MSRGVAGGLKALGTLVALAALVFLGIWVANSWLLPRHVGSGSSFSMPLLEGSSRDEVFALCVRRGLVVAEQPPEYDVSLPSGYVLRQNPRPGDKVKPGRRVRVVFSAGPRLAAIPDLRGQSERQARLSLEDLGLVPGDLLRSPGEVAAGRVLSSRPGPGARVPAGTRVDLLLSRGPGGRAYLVPDLRRRDLDSALALLEGSSLPKPRIRYREGSAAPAGSILEQSPPPGSRLQGGRTLELVVVSQPR